MEAEELNKRKEALNRAWNQLGQVFKTDLSEISYIIIDGKKVSILELFPMAERNDKAFEIIKKIRKELALNRGQDDAFIDIITDAIGKENVVLKTKSTFQEPPKQEARREQQEIIIPQEVLDAIDALNDLPNVDINKDEIFYHEQKKNLKIKKIIDIALKGNAYAQNTILNYADVMVGAYEDELAAQEARSHARARAQNSQSQSREHSYSSEQDHDTADHAEDDDVISYIENCIAAGLNPKQRLAFKYKNKTKRRILEDVLADARDYSDPKKQEIAIWQLEDLKAKLIEWRRKQRKSYAKKNSGKAEKKQEQTSSDDSFENQNTNFEEPNFNIDENEYRSAHEYLKGLFDEKLIEKYRTIKAGQNNVKIWDMVKEANKDPDNLNPYYKMVLINVAKNYRKKEAKLRSKATKRQENIEKSNAALKQAFSDLGKTAWTILRAPDRAAWYLAKIGGHSVNAAANLLESWKHRDKKTFALFGAATLGALAYAVTYTPTSTYSDGEVLERTINYQNSDSYEGGVIVRDDIAGCTLDSFNDYPPIYQSYINYMGDRFGTDSPFYLQAQAFVDQALHLYDEGIVDGYINPQLHYLLVQRETGFRDAHNSGTDASGQAQFIRSTFLEDSNRYADYSAVLDMWEAEETERGFSNYENEQYYAIKRFLSGEGTQDIDEQLFQNMRFWSFATQIVATKLAIEHPNLLLDPDDPQAFLDDADLLGAFQQIYDPHFGGAAGAKIINDPSLQDVGVTDFATIQRRIETSDRYSAYERSRAAALSQFWARQAPVHNSFINVAQNPKLSNVHDMIYADELSTAGSRDGLSNIGRAIVAINGWDQSVFEQCVDTENPYVVRLRGTVIEHPSVLQRGINLYNGATNSAYSISMPDLSAAISRLNPLPRSQATELTQGNDNEQTNNEGNEGIEPPSRKPVEIAERQQTPTPAPAEPQTFSQTFEYRAGAFGDTTLREREIEEALGDDFSRVRLDFQNVTTATGQQLTRVTITSSDPNLCRRLPGACQKVN